MGKEIPNYFVWNIGVMMFYFSWKPKLFCDSMPSNIILTANDNFNRFQGGNTSISISLKGAINSLNYAHFEDEDKIKFKDLVDSTDKDKITNAYLKVLVSKNNNITIEEKLLELIKKAFNTPLNQQFNLKTYSDYKTIVNNFFSLDNITNRENTNAITEKDTLHLGQKLSKLYFEKISNRGRFESYINTEDKRVTIKNRVKSSSNSNEYELCELVFGNFNDIDRDCSISLHGVGGTGKTFQLLSLYEMIIKYPEKNILNVDLRNVIPMYLELNVIPIYLELNDVSTNTDNCILVVLSRSLSIDLDVLINILNEQGSNVILMLDGYNEVTDGDLREEIAKMICDIRHLYKTRIIITSRIDHSNMFNRINRGESAIFTEAKIQPLSADQINAYFKAIGLHNTYYKRLGKSVKRLIQKAQGLAMYGDLKKKKTLNRIKNLGTLLSKYTNDILLEDVEDNTFETYLEEIAYHMVFNGWFEIKPSDLKSLIDEKHGNNASDSILNNSSIKKLFVKDDSTGNFKFTHQNFRDMYCAIHLNELMSDFEKNINSFTSNNITTNDEILVLCGDLIKNDRAIQASINKLKDSDPSLDYSFVLSVLIRIFAFRNGNDIHKLNLGNLNLSKVSLSGYTLYHKNHKKDDRTGELRTKTFPINLEGATVSENTFEKNGLKRGSSTICKFTKDKTEYVVAFCSTSLIIYNTKTAEWTSIRYNFKDPTISFGWINCACHIENEKIIILGTETGYITYFSYKDQPYVNTDPNLFLKYPEDCKHVGLKYGCSIQSIVCLNNLKTSEYSLMASNSSGAIFILESDSVKTIRNPDENEISLIRDTFMLSYNENDLSICKIASNDIYLFYSWGNKIYRKTLSEPFDNFIEWKSLVYSNQRCIFDIYCTDIYLFVNTGKNILIFSIDTGEILDDYSYSKTNNKENLTVQDQIRRFTKLSKFENYSNKVLIGISAEDEDRNTLPNYIILTVEDGEDENGDTKYFTSHYPLFGINQTMTTFSAISFYHDKHYYIATTSNDRSTQILCVDIEDFKAIRHSGTYDGVRHIELISPNEILLSQYDGSVSHWKFSNKVSEWHCMDVYPIHLDWVWKTRYYVDNDNNEYFFSCSYDGTVKRTNIKTYVTDILIEDDDKIVDLVLIKSSGTLSYIVAATTHKIILFDYINKQIVKNKEFTDIDEDHKTYSKYTIESMSPALDDTSLVLIAVNFKANHQNGKIDTARIYSVSKNLDFRLLNKIWKNELYKYSKIEGLVLQNNALTISGIRIIENDLCDQIDIYRENNIETPDLKKILSSSEIIGRRKVCTILSNEQFFIGCLDGSVFVLKSPYENPNLLPAFITHANLISVFPVKMKNVRWINDSQIDSFKGYFQII
jgi:hypothetical protein